MRSHDWSIGSTLLLAACGDPGACPERAGDSDCDGVPDVRDFCSGTDPEALHDAAGCSDAQSAGCRVELLAPEDGADVLPEDRFGWNGDCDVWLVEFSDDAAFAPARTRVALRTQATESMIVAPERYWRVTGGRYGRSAGVSSPVRERRTP